MNRVPPLIHYVEEDHPHTYVIEVGPPRTLTQFECLYFCKDTSGCPDFANTPLCKTGFRPHPSGVHWEAITTIKILGNFYDDDGVPRPCGWASIEAPIKEVYFGNIGMFYARGMSLGLLDRCFGHLQDLPFLERLTLHHFSVKLIPNLVTIDFGDLPNLKYLEIQFDTPRISIMPFMTQCKALETLVLLNKLPSDMEEREDEDLHLERLSLLPNLKVKNIYNIPELSTQ